MAAIVSASLVVRQEGCADPGNAHIIGTIKGGHTTTNIGTFSGSSRGDRDGVSFGLEQAKGGGQERLQGHPGATTRVGDLGDGPGLAQQTVTVSTRRVGALVRGP